MLYYNIKNPNEIVTLKQAVIDGVSEDGGLYMPQSIVRLPQAFVRNMGHMTLQEIAYAIANFAFQGDIDADVLHDMVYDTLDFDIPLRRIDDSHYVLELFHGPTMAFKDLGARFMARMLHHYRSLHHEWPTIHVLVATSGDTGAAVANSFVGVPGELCCELGQEIKWHSPFRRTFIAYNSTAYMSYMGPANFLVAGGYEAVSQRFSARGGLALLNTAVEAMFELREANYPSEGEPYPDQCSGDIVNILPNR